jgi:hypothetical protein
MSSSSSTSSSSRHVAFSDQYNSIWIHSTPVNDAQSPSETVPQPNSAIPIINAPTEYPSASSSSSPHRPSASRTHSSKVRKRADSIASSVITTGSFVNGSRGTFSPPPSTRVPQAVLTNTTVSASPHDHKLSHREEDEESGSPQGTTEKEKLDLLDQLRQQRDRNESNEGIGLGIGFSRKIQVHSKDDIEGSGLTSPPPGQQGSRSTASLESNRTIGGIRAWFKSDEEKAMERDKEMKERLEEVEVQREMEREVEEDKRDKDDIKALERCLTSTPQPESGQTSAVEDVQTDAQPGGSLKRIVLDQPSRGSIVCVRVLERVHVLAVLRDIGYVWCKPDDLTFRILDLISLDSLEVAQSVPLEQPEPRSDEAGETKSSRRLPPFWSWRGVHLAQAEDVGSPVFSLHILG